MLSDSFGDSFFDGPGMQAAKGPLIGGGLAQLGILATKILLPSYVKYAGLFGAILGGGVSAFLMTKPQHKEAGAAGLATALIIGIPRQIEDLMGGTLKDADDLSAYTSDMGAYAMDGPSGMEFMAPPVEIQDSGSGSTGVMGAVTSEMGATPEGLAIQGADFGATGF